MTWLRRTFRASQKLRLFVQHDRVKGQAKRSGAMSHRSSNVQAQEPDGSDSDSEGSAVGGPSGGTTQPAPHPHAIATAPPAQLGQHAAVGHGNARGGHHGLQAAGHHAAVHGQAQHHAAVGHGNARGGHHGLQVAGHQTTAHGQAQHHAAYPHPAQQPGQHLHPQLAHGWQQQQTQATHNAQHLAGHHGAPMHQTNPTTLQQAPHAHHAPQHAHQLHAPVQHPPPAPVGPQHNPQGAIYMGGLFGQPAPGAPPPQATYDGNDPHYLQYYYGESYDTHNPGRAPAQPLPPHNRTQPPTLHVPPPAPLNSGAFPGSTRCTHCHLHGGLHTADCTRPRGPRRG